MTLIIKILLLIVKMSWKKPMKINKIKKMKTKTSETLKKILFFFK
jgi:hypothetical protein